jgi:epoxyqueuosine reductase QueG
MPSLKQNRLWVEKTLAELVRESPENHLSDFQGQAIFDAPLVGVADGADDVFAQLLTAVSPRHLMPKDFLRRNSPPEADLGCVRVIVWALAFTQEVRASNRGSDWPSRLYSLARNNGGALIHNVSIRFAELLRERGWAAAAPSASEEYDAFRSPEHTFASTWSERHVAYAAGLGQFGLSGALLTPLGSNVRFGSVVTNLPLKPTPRSCDTHQAPCLESGGRDCGACIARCPVGAISNRGMDKSKCYEMRRAIRERFMEKYSQEMKMLAAPVTKSGRKSLSYSLGCALCQCGVPCEGQRPDPLG